MCNMHVITYDYYSTTFYGGDRQMSNVDLINCIFCILLLVIVRKMFSNFDLGKVSKFVLYICAICLSILLVFSLLFAGGIIE